MRLSPRTLDQIHSPIGEAFALGMEGGKSRPLLNMSQAAPAYATAPAIIAHIAEQVHAPDIGGYAPQPGLRALREVFAAELSTDYQGAVSPNQVLITPGCNQAFCLVASALAGPGHNIILVSPFYFDHDMWLRLDGTEVKHLVTGDDLMPDADAAAALIDDRTAAIVMVTPGNPTGAIAEPALIRSMAEMARRHDVALVIDETYRSYRGTDAPAHDLFAEPGWDDTVVSLHSFSKDFALPGYRVGAMVGSAELLAESMKLLDCLTICTPRIGQEAVWAGLTQARSWRAEKVAETLARQAHFEMLMADQPGGYELVSAGAYFGWLRHPFADRPTKDVVRSLVVDHDVLMIPGDAFTAGDEHMIRSSFANLTIPDLDELALRLSE